MRVLYLFFSIKFRKFWHTARLSRTNRHKVIKSENSPFFGPPCITYTSHQDKAGSFSIHNINQASTKLYKRLFYIADKHFTSKKTNGKKYQSSNKTAETIRKTSQTNIPGKMFHGKNWHFLRRSFASSTAWTNKKCVSKVTHSIYMTSTYIWLPGHATED